MANIFAPTGFQPLSILSGEVGSMGQGTALVSKSDAVPLFRGDPVVRLPTGYVTRATPGTTQIHGVFLGCSYVSVLQGKTIFSNYYPGSDAALDVTANIHSYPNSTMTVQSGNGGPVTLANVGQNVNFAIGTGNTFSQISGAYVDFATIANTSTLPFRIIGLVNAPPTANGADTTTAFNSVVVSFNNQDFIVLTGI